MPAIKNLNDINAACPEPAKECDTTNIFSYKLLKFNINKDTLYSLKVNLSI